MGRWVKTANGQNFADSIGVAEPPLELEESVQGVLNQVCALREPLWPATNWISPD